MSVKIESTAIVNKKAELGLNVKIGHYSIIGEKVKIGDNTEIKDHVIITNDTLIGNNNTIFPNAVLGEIPQDLKFKSEDTRLVVGNNNVIREFATMNVGTEHGGGTTRVGDDNLLMAYSHIAHDCQIGSNVVMANVATLAGHVEVGNHAIVGGVTAVHQFVKIGEYSIIGGASRVSKDVLPFSKVAGIPLKVLGINGIGLRRNGFSKERIEIIEKVFKILFKSNHNISQAIKIIESNPIKQEPDIQKILNFIKSSARGISK